ncbi:Protein fmp52-2 [Paramyrothecium foliicola]|nr:Protein fmp52-2 [Paramyrothecium foliicola]
MAATTASSSSAAIIGSTGLVGSHILSTLLATDAYKPVHSITRRAPKTAGANLDAIVEADTSAWAARLSGLAPPPKTVFSALGTTRAAAGGLQNQWKIDHDLNIELARAAREAGSRTYVFVSSAGTRSALSSFAPYCKMKNGVEDAIRDLDFEHAVILKPGTILGAREHARPAEAAFQGLVRSLSRVNQGWQDALGQDADVIGRAAVRAVELVDEGRAPSKYWVLEASDILRLGRDEPQAAHGAAESKPAAE